MRERNVYIEGLKPDARSFEKEDSERVAKKFDTNTYIKDGVVRWKSNNQVPPTEVLEFWDYLGKKFNFEKSKEVRADEVFKTIEEYKKSQQNKEYSQEELFEMRAAFGEGAEVVNVLTGRRIKL